MADTKLFINGEWIAAGIGRDVPDVRTVDGREDRRRRQGRPRRRATCHRGGAQGVRRRPVAEDVGQGARREAAQGRRAHHRPFGRDRRDRSARRRRHDQEGDVRRRSRRGVHVRVLRRAARRTSPTSIDRGESPFPPAKSIVRREPYRRVHAASCRGTSRSSWPAGRSRPRSRPATARC